MNTLKHTEKTLNNEGVEALANLVLGIAHRATSDVEQEGEVEYSGCCHEEAVSELEDVNHCHGEILNNIVPISGRAEGDTFVASFSCVGLSKKDVVVENKDGAISVGTNDLGLLFAFRPFNGEVDEGSIKAKLEKGLLSIVLRKTAEIAPTSISIS